jgi:hypothetical protein
MMHRTDLLLEGRSLEPLLRSSLPETCSPSLVVQTDITLHVPLDCSAT